MTNELQICHGFLNQTERKLMLSMKFDQYLLLLYSIFIIGTYHITYQVVYTVFPTLKRHIQGGVFQTKMYICNRLLRRGTV